MSSNMLRPYLFLWAFLVAALGSTVILAWLLEYPPVITTTASQAALDAVTKSLLLYGQLPTTASSYAKVMSPGSVVIWRLEVWFSSAASMVGYVGLAASGLANRRLRKVLGDYAYELLVSSKGSGTRLRMLKVLNRPSTRYSLVRELGMDWKEVERNLSLLVDAGLVKAFREDGKLMYMITNDGVRALEVIEGLSTLDPLRSLDRLFGDASK